jgi:hypothetical protein
MIDQSILWVFSNAIPVACWLSLGCVIFSARIATGFLRHNPRLFTVMALFACTWAHVLGYYTLQAHGQSGSELSGLLTDFAAVLLVYIGGLLILDSTDHKSGALEPVYIISFQSAAFVLLLFVATPRAIEISAPNPVLILRMDDVKHLVSAGLDVLAFVSIALGAYRIHKGWLYYILLAILVLYGALQVEYDLRCSWTVCADSLHMPAGYALTFAILKVAFTVSFGSIVAYYGMTEKWKRAGAFYWILHLIYLAPEPPEPARALAKSSQ